MSRRCRLGIESYVMWGVAVKASMARHSIKGLVQQQSMRHSGEPALSAWDRILRDVGYGGQDMRYDHISL